MASWPAAAPGGASASQAWAVKPAAGARHPDHYVHRVAVVSAPGLGDEGVGQAAVLPPAQEPGDGA